MTARHHQQGITLIEMMVTLSIVAIIVALAGPPYRDFVQNQRLSAAASELQRALSYARAEAMTRARRVTVCASSNTTSCAAKAAGDWRQGWIVFVDDGTTIGLLDAGSTTEVILRVHQGPLNGVTAASSGTKLAPRLSDTTLYVSYTGTGYAQFADGGFQEGSIFFCDGRGVPFAKSVDVMATGMPRVDSAAGSDPGC